MHFRNEARMTLECSLIITPPKPNSDALNAREALVQFGNNLEIAYFFLLLNLL